jgi:hypothetical protein
MMIRLLSSVMGLLGSLMVLGAQNVLGGEQIALTKNQASIGCSIDENGVLSCPGPGTGLCWAKGHNPYFDETPLSIDVGNPGSENFGREELCSVMPDRGLKVSPKPEECQSPCF